MRCTPSRPATTAVFGFGDATAPDVGGGEPRERRSAVVREVHVVCDARAGPDALLAARDEIIRRRRGERHAVAERGRPGDPTSGAGQAGTADHTAVVLDEPAVRTGEDELDGDGRPGPGRDRERILGPGRRVGRRRPDPEVRVAGLHRDGVDRAARDREGEHVDERRAHGLPVRAAVDRVVQLSLLVVAEHEAVRGVGEADLRSDAVGDHDADPTHRSSRSIRRRSSRRRLRSSRAPSLVGVTPKWPRLRAECPRRPAPTSWCSWSWCGRRGVSVSTSAGRRECWSTARPWSVSSASSCSRRYGDLRARVVLRTDDGEHDGHDQHERAGAQREAVADPARTEVMCPRVHFVAFPLTGDRRVGIAAARRSRIRSRRDLQ